MPLPCTVRFGVEGCQGGCPGASLRPLCYPACPAMPSRLMTRLILLLAFGGVAAAAILLPSHRTTLLEAAVAGLLVVGLADLFTLGLERLVGMRYLHRGRRSRGARLALVVGVALMVVGFGLFTLAHGRSRALETVAVLGVLAGWLTAVVAFLLRT